MLNEENELMMPAADVGKYTFQICVIKVKEFYEKTNNLLDNMVKLDVIQQCLRKYLNDEDQADVFEGFVRLVCYLDTITTQLAKQHDLSLVKILLNAYYEFLREHPELTEAVIEFNDSATISNALKILAGLKFKHAQIISKIFQLKNQSMIPFSKQMISEIIERGDYPKAIQWMACLNICNQFPFEKTVCHLIAENQIGMLDTFVGDAEYRKKDLVKYLDRLIGYHFKHMTSTDEMENTLIRDYKRLQKLARRYVKNFNCRDSEVPNLMNSSAYDALIFHHYSWQNGEKSWDHFVEMALSAIADRAEIRNQYFNFLCDRALTDKAIHFAQMLNLKESDYPPRLHYFLQQNPSTFSDIRDKIKSKNEVKRRNEEIESENVCKLDDGTPILVVDDKASFNELIEVLHKCNKNKKEVIGIDAEWRPHYLSATERISIIQIAITNAVYIVDVLWLEEYNLLIDEDWVKFFTTLLCNETRKIGYDIRNDIRVIKSTFRFIDNVLTESKNIICLFRLFQQIMLTPDASKFIFGPHPPQKLGLSEVVEHFLKIQLEKKERIGNWCLRPLRMEQKKYAAMDAYSLVQLYRLIAPIIKTSLRPGLQLSLQECAIVKIISEEKQMPHMPVMNGQILSNKEGEDDFVTNIQKVSGELLNGTMTIKSVDDVRFVVDSMLFGLGKHLRKCGFDTRLISDREEIVQFCKKEENNDFIVLSTGKGYKQLEGYLGSERCLNVPVSTHTGAIAPSLLVNHVMRQMNIAIRPENMWSRCVECNKRAFVKLPIQIVRVLSYMSAVSANAEWLEITEEDLKKSIEILRDDSELAIKLTPEIHNGEHPTQNTNLLGENDYYLYEDENHVLCQTRYCTVDVINKLLLAEGRGAPVTIRVGLKYKKETFNELDLIFFVCVECGRVQYDCPNNNGDGDD